MYSRSVELWGDTAFILRPIGASALLIAALDRYWSTASGLGGSSFSICSGNSQLFSSTCYRCIHTKSTIYCYGLTSLSAAGHRHLSFSNKEVLTINKFQWLSDDHRAVTQRAGEGVPSAVRELMSPCCRQQTSTLLWTCCGPWCMFWWALCLSLRSPTLLLVQLFFLFEVLWFE